LKIVQNVLGILKNPVKIVQNVLGMFQNPVRDGYIPHLLFRMSEAR